MVVVCCVPCSLPTILVVALFLLVLYIPPLTVVSQVLLHVGCDAHFTVVAYQPPYTTHLFALTT